MENDLNDPIQDGSVKIKLNKLKFNIMSTGI